MTILACERKLPPDELARQNREALKDKSYRAYPLGQEAARYLRASRRRFTKDTYRDYESCLDKFSRFFADLELADFEPPIGTERLEEFLDQQWGHREPRTYNKNHSILSEFFKFQRAQRRLHGDPMLGISKAKKRAVLRQTFSEDERRAILAANPGQPDATALRLLLTYALRKGSLQELRFEHFDFSRRRVTFKAKGGKWQTVPVPDQAFWADLDIWMRQERKRPSDYLLCRQQTAGVKARATTQYPDQPMGGHGLHSWWYRCLAKAGIVASGVEAGERMHKARHTAGQRILDKTRGNLKAVQKLLGHESIQTTGDIYTDWDIDQLEQTLASLEDE